MITDDDGDGGDSFVMGLPDETLPLNDCLAIHTRPSA